MRLAFVGDIALGDHPKTVGFGFRSAYPDGIPPALTGRVQPPAAPPDFFFGNMEFALGFDAGTPGDLTALQCRGLDGYARFLAAAGVSALNVANNHASQSGRPVFDATVRRLKEAGIHVVGTPADFTDAGLVAVGEERIALLGWSDRPRQYSPEPPPYNEFSDRAYEQIALARQRADRVIASIHWGEEFVLVPSAREQEIAHRMVDAGASYVIGHHPHVLREIEQYGGSVIAYSLGNFIGDMIWDDRTRVTGWLTVEDDGDGGLIPTLTPAVIGDDYFPQPLDDRPSHRLWHTTMGARIAHANRVTRSDYHRVADQERRRHARLTAWMMLRHVHRYPAGTAREVFRGALAHRLRRLLSRPAL